MSWLSVSSYDWCSGGESNPYGFLHWILSPARLPVPPPEQIFYKVYVFVGQKLFDLNCDALPDGPLSVPGQTVAHTVPVLFCVAFDPADANFDGAFEFLKLFYEVFCCRGPGTCVVCASAEFDQALTVGVDSDIGEPVLFCELDSLDNGKRFSLGIVLALAGKTPTNFFNQCSVDVQKTNADSAEIAFDACVCVYDCFDHDI